MKYGDKTRIADAAGISRPYFVNILRGHRSKVSWKICERLAYIVPGTQPQDWASGDTAKINAVLGQKNFAPKLFPM